MFYWWTVSLCLIAGEEKNHVTTAGLCLSLYLATLEAKRGSLYFLGYCMLVALFYQLFMKKCERDILTEIKKEHIMKATLRLSAVRSCRRVVVNAACKAMDLCLYQTGGSHLNLTPRRHLSVLAACVCACEWVRACVRRIWGRVDGVGVLSESGNSLLAEGGGVKTGMWVTHLLSASLVSLRLL